MRTGRAPARIDLDERADAVVLRLVDEAVGFERRVFERGEHRTHRLHVAAPLHVAMRQ